MSAGQPRRVKRGWMNLEVVAIRQDTPDCKTLFFQDFEEKNCPFDYYAGQYLTFRFDDLTTKPIVRSYTMSSAPSKNPLVEVSVKEISEGLVSRYLCRDIKVGDVLRARGPMGAFIYRPGKDFPRLVMVGAGSGVTPFLSILAEYADRLGKDNAPKELVLLASYRSREDIIGKELFAQLQGKAGIKVIISLSRENNSGFLSGRINNEFIRAASENRFDQTTFMTCGPQEMMDQTMLFLQAQGVAADHIRTESFFT